MSQPGLARGAVVGALLGLLLGLWGCTPPADPGVTDVPTEPVPSTSPSASVRVVVPATGPVITSASFVVRVPSDYGEGRPDGAKSVSSAKGGCSRIQVGEQASEDVPLANLVWSFGNLHQWSSRPDRLPDLAFAGETWFRLHGYGKGDLKSDDITVYGTYRQGRVVALWFQRNLLNECGLPVADIEAEWNSVMATVRWR